jgi:hypothetical protein
MTARCSKKPRVLDEINAASQSHFEKWGGLQMLGPASMSDMAMLRQLRGRNPFSRSHSQKCNDHAPNCRSEESRHH